MKKLYIILSLLALSCASIMPGGITVSESKYDGVKTVYAGPGWANDSFGSKMKIGFIKNSNMEKNKAIIIARYDDIENFSAKHPNFFIKINNKETKLSPVSDSTECEISSSVDVAHCYQQYIVDLSLLEEMSKSDDVRFKLYLRSRSVTGSLKNKGMSTARNGLENFLISIKKEFK